MEIPAKWAGRVTRDLPRRGRRPSRSAPRSSRSTPSPTPVRRAANRPPRGARRPRVSAGTGDGGAGRLRPAHRRGAAPAAPQHPHRRHVREQRRHVRDRWRRLRARGRRRGAGAAAPAAGRHRDPAGRHPAAGAGTAVPATAAPAAVTGRPSRPVLAKPPVRKLARDLGVDLTALTGSGPAGSITREDVQQARGAARDGGDAAASGRPATGGAAAFGAGPGAAHPGQGGTQAHRGEHGRLGVHRAARHRVPDRRRDPVDEGAGPAARPPGVARRTGLAAAAGGEGGAAGGAAGTRWSTRPGPATRSWSRTTSTSASRRPPSAA